MILQIDKIKKHELLELFVSYKRKYKFSAVICLKMTNQLWYNCLIEIFFSDIYFIKKKQTYS